MFLKYNLSFLQLAALLTVAQGFTAANPPFLTNSMIQTCEGQSRNKELIALTAKGRKGDDENNDEEKYVTKEMFLRDMLQSDDVETTNEDETETTTSNKEPKKGTTKRKKRNGSHYRVLDNRDNLPFLVKVTTPDPYTNNEIMAKKAKKNTEEFSKGSKNSKKNKKGNTISNKRHNLIGMDGFDSIKSSIFRRKKDGTLDQVLGEFALDKATNCGDIVDVGDGREYQVQKARCQYKYVGGKKFVMTRKILEVKELKRILVEKEVKQLFDNDGKSNDDDILQLE